MGHTEGRFTSDLGSTDNVLFMGPNECLVSGTGVVTRNAAGNWSINQAQSLTVIYAFELTQANFIRTGVGGPGGQEQFGGTGVTGPLAAPLGYPPFSAASQLTPRSTYIPKGININSLSLVYFVGTTALTSQVCRLDSTLFANAAAPVITNILASAANGLVVTASANDYVTAVTGLPASFAGANAYLITPTTKWTLEITVVTPASSTYQLFGLSIGATINWM
jgi:hypothetical protein